MPKMKTHKGAKKRTKVKPGGKIEITKKNRNHNTGKKRSKVTRQSKNKQYMKDCDKSRIKTMLGL